MQNRREVLALAVPSRNEQVESRNMESFAAPLRRNPKKAEGCVPVSLSPWSKFHNKLTASQCLRYGEARRETDQRKHPADHASPVSGTEIAKGLRDVVISSRRGVTPCMSSSGHRRKHADRDARGMLGLRHKEIMRT